METEEIYAERRRLVVEELRSGRLTQGIGYLERRDGKSGETQNCCMGVMCRVAMGNGLEVETFPLGNAPNIMAFNGNAAFLPAAVGAWFGLFGDGFHDDGDQDVRLEVADGVKEWASVLNDGERWTFAEIADAMVRTWKL